MATPSTTSSNLCCTICSEIYKSNEDILCTKCGHIFHKSCFQEWHTRSATCPQCRENQPQTQPIYLHLEDPTEAENGREEARLTLVNKISFLERKLEESEQQFFDTQCALTFSDERVDELTTQLEYMNVINSSYEQEQTNIREALAEAQQELSFYKKQTDELRSQLECINKINASYEEEQRNNKTQMDGLRNELDYVNALNSSREDEETKIKVDLKELQQAFDLIKLESDKLRSELEVKNTIIDSLEREIDKKNKRESCNCSKKIEALKLENEKKISDLLQEHTAAEATSEQVHVVLQNQLKFKEDQLTRLKQDITKFKNENHYQNIDKNLNDDKSDNVFLLQEKNRRLETKIKNLTAELEKEVELSTKLTVEVMKLKSFSATQKQDYKDKEEVLLGCEKNDLFNKEESSSKHLLDFLN